MNIIIHAIEDLKGDGVANMITTTLYEEDGEGVVLSRPRL